MQSRLGLFVITPEVDASSFLGGFFVGGIAGFAPGVATTNSGGALVAVPRQKVTADIPTLTNGATVTHNNCGVVITTNGGAVTGIIVQVGSFHGQHLIVINNVAGTVTMAAAGTSNVASGVTAVIPATAALGLVWNAIDSRWYDVG